MVFLTEIDPARAVARLEAVPEDPKPGFDPVRDPKNRAILTLASFFKFHGFA